MKVGSYSVHLDITVASVSERGNSGMTTTLCSIGRLALFGTLTVGAFNFTVLGVGAIAAPSPAPVELRLNLQSGPYGVRDIITAQVVLKNISKAPLRTALFLRTYDGNLFLSFNVLRDNERLRYRGGNLNMGLGGVKEVYLEPGNTVSAEINLTDCYDMTKPGTYVVKAIYRQPPQNLLDKHGKPNVITEELRSNEVTIRVGDENKLFEKNLEIFQKGKEGGSRITHSLRAFETEHGVTLGWEYTIDRGGRKTQGCKDLRIVAGSDPVLVADRGGKVYVFSQPSADKYILHVHDPSPAAGGVYFHEFSIKEGIAPPSLIVRANGEVIIFSEEKRWLSRKTACTRAMMISDLYGTRHRRPMSLSPIPGLLLCS